MQKYTNNANGDAPLTVENVIFLISFDIKVRTCYFGKKKQSWSIAFFIKIFLLSFLF